LRTILSISMFCALAIPVCAQSQIDYPTQTKPTTRPVKTGTVLPALCTVGDLFVNTAASSGANLSACLTQNTWTQQNSGGGTGSGGATVTTAFSTTPTFTCPSSTSGTVVLFKLNTALSANIASSALSSCTGSLSTSSFLTFVFTQAVSGGPYSVAMPTGFSQACQISPISGADTNMTFSWDGTTAHLISCQANSGPGVCARGSGTCGIAALSSGTVTVATSAIGALASSGTPGYVVFLTLQNCSGCGVLSLGTVIAGSSFVINSTNGSDSSRVIWEIQYVN
jgi:hypothetical protein